MEALQCLCRFTMASWSWTSSNTMDPQYKVLQYRSPACKDRGGQAANLYWVKPLQTHIHMQPHKGQGGLRHGHHWPLPDKDYNKMSFTLDDRRNRSWLLAYKPLLFHTSLPQLFNGLFLDRMRCIFLAEAKLFAPLHYPGCFPQLAYSSTGLAAGSPFTGQIQEAFLLKTVLSAVLGNLHILKGE